MPEFKAPWPEENGIWHTYDFHCHCGAIRWQTTLSPPLYAEHAQGKEQFQAIECACSVCDRFGYIIAHPHAKNVTFTRGADPSQRGEYFTANKINPHWFCKTCGSSVGSDLTKAMEMFGEGPRYLINLRMLKDYDHSKLNVKQVDGLKNAPPEYEIGP